MLDPTKPLHSEAPLIVYVDVKSPYAFVAIKPTLKLEQELGMQFDWRPLTLDIPSYLGSARKKAGKVVESNRTPTQWLGIKYAYKDARRYAERQGYILKGTEKIWDSSLVNMAILWVSEHGRDRLEQFFDVVYPAFWRRELDVESLEVVLAAIDEASVTSDGFSTFAAGEGRRVHDELMSRLHAAGVYGVPTYVFDEHILFGREHLPYIRWHLGGKQGPPPDIAYEIG